MPAVVTVQPEADVPAPVGVVESGVAGDGVGVAALAAESVGAPSFRLQARERIAISAIEYWRTLGHLVGVGSM